MIERVTNNNQIEDKFVEFSELANSILKKLILNLKFHLIRL